MPDLDAVTMADEYRRLGGTRTVELQGDVIIMSPWSGEPPEAEAYWRQNVATLPTEQRNAVAKALVGR